MVPSLVSTEWGISDCWCRDFCTGAVTPSNRLTGLFPGVPWLFDGFPRTTAQAEALDTFLQGKGYAISGMLALEVPEEELRTRLAKRAETSGRVDDADPQVIQKRIDVYNKETAPVAEHYRAQAKYIGVQGVGSMEEIFDRLSAAIKGLS
mgnify:CR=1 FL=1